VIRAATGETYNAISDANAVIRAKVPGFAGDVTGLRIAREQRATALFEPMAITDEVAAALIE